MSVAQCIEIYVKAKSDEQRFASLLLLTKAAAPGDAADVSAIFDGIGVKFLRRLLLSSKVPEGCPPDIYAGIACSILASFASVPRLAATPEIVELVDHLLRIIDGSVASQSAAASPPPSCEDNTSCDATLPERPVQLDALQAVLGIVRTPEGRMAVMRVGGEQPIASLLLAPGTSTAAASAAVGVLVALAAADAGGPPRLPAARLVATIDAVAASFARRNDEAMFEACGALGTILTVVSEFCEPGTQAAAAVLGSNNWPSSTASGLRKTLGGRLGPAERLLVFRVAAVTTELMKGIGWTLLVSPVAPSVGNFFDRAGDTPVPASSSPGELALLLTRLASVELRMALEDRSVAQATEMREIVVYAFVITEAALEALVSSGEDLAKEDAPVAARQQQRPVEPPPAFAEVLGSEGVVNIHTALTEGFGAVLELLSTMQREGTSLASQDSGQAALLRSTGRAACVWLAEDTAAHRELVLEVIPFLLATAKTEEELVGSEDIAQVDPPPSLLRMLLPGLCHLTADDTARRVCLKADCHRLILRGLIDSWLPLARTATHSAAFEQSAETACGVLLNIVVLEPGLVAEDASFEAIAAELTSELLAPGLGWDERPVLHGNLALLLLRLSVGRQTIADSLPWHEVLPRIAGFLKMGGDTDGTSELWGLTTQAIASTPALCSSLTSTLRPAVSSALGEEAVVALASAFADLSQP